MLRESYTVVLERNTTWSGPFATEAYESAWASEAIFFVRLLAHAGNPAACSAKIQISPDGMHWCDEGTEFALPDTDNAVAFGRVTGFGGWLRIQGELLPNDEVKVIVYLNLKA
jgi:hypothetical protein